MLADSLARRFTDASSAPSGRAAGAVLAALFFFLLPAAAQEPSGGGAAQTPGRVKTERLGGPKVITNADLEPSRLRREAQEAEYERTRRERGLPSKQELQRYFEEQDRRLHELALRIQAERAEAELESVRSELVNLKLDLNRLSLHLSQQTGGYIPTYVYPNYHPYYNAPPVLIITRFPLGQRGVLGRGKFGLHPRGGTWPYNPRHGLFSHPLGRPPLHRITPPRAPAPTRPALRR
jgi:hypothetical protein